MFPKLLEIKLAGRRKITRAEQKKAAYYIILVSIIITILLIILINRNRFITISELDDTVSELTVSIESLETEVDSLRTEIDRLTNDSLYMEHVIRGILGWGREGENIIRFIRVDTTEAVN